MTIQALYGIIPNVSGKGQCARVSNFTLYTLIRIPAQQIWVLMIAHGKCR